MENAAKALLIAGGILIGLIVISLMVFGYNRISDYYREKEAIKVTDQLIEFNKDYVPYNRDDVRGSDLLSLINKIIDYNSVKMDDINEEKIEITITIPKDADEKYKNFYYKYDESTSKNKLIKFNFAYTHNNINRELLATANSIESKYPQGMAKKLADNRTTLMGDNTRKTKKELLVELKIMNKDDTTNPDNYVDNDEILKYYQYLQFKRAHFNCEELTFTTQGRVKSFKFVFNGKFE